MYTPGGLNLSHLRCRADLLGERHRGPPGAYLPHRARLPGESFSVGGLGGGVLLPDQQLASARLFCWFAAPRAPDRGCFSRPANLRISRYGAFPENSVTQKVGFSEGSGAHKSMCT